MTSSSGVRYFYFSRIDRITFTVAVQEFYYEASLILFILLVFFIYSVAVSERHAPHTDGFFDLLLVDDFLSFFSVTLILSNVYNLVLTRFCFKRAALVVATNMGVVYYG